MFNPDSIEQTVVTLKSNYSDELFNRLSEEMNPYYTYRAKTYHISGYDADDIMQECLYSLNDAVNSFECSRNVRFVTYAIALADNRLNRIYREQKKQAQIIYGSSLDQEETLHVIESQKIDNIDKIDELIIMRQEYADVIQSLSKLEFQILIRLYLENETREDIMEAESLTERQFRAAKDRLIRKFQNAKKEPKRGRNFYSHKKAKNEKDMLKEELDVTQLPENLDKQARLLGWRLSKRRKNSP
ncbi:hypothetical protein CL176_11960 [Suicoccus acidiformans]|uniref:RNA polymerase sigma-70 region 2 domain-containing protein n=1 Tax=Suicoccus acidiformans TaxID=2036206 RepID=A0A347WNJ8_9LACT|nr:sigma-70 family RNA polymerase sigma factor [Suicoccus acidiformans]AXY26655.1 hypothetical protein CL176_11960 [Suicoccus acidiformans]